MKINPEHLKGVFDYSPHFLTSKRMFGNVKSVVLSWQASIRTHGEDKDGDLSACLCKIGIWRLGEILRFFPNSAALKSLCMTSKIHPNYDVSGIRTLQKNIMLFQNRLLQEQYIWLMFISLHDRACLVIAKGVYTALSECFKRYFRWKLILLISV